MKFESIILKDKPRIEFFFRKNDFEILNEREGNHNGVFTYELLNSVGIKQEKTNWLVTILSFIVEMIFSTNSQGVYKKKSLLELNYKNEKIDLDLEGCNSDKAELITNKLKLEIGKVKPTHNN